VARPGVDMVAGRVAIMFERRPRDVVHHGGKCALLAAGKLERHVLLPTFKASQRSDVPK